ncbi:MAG: hypothetical protein AAGU05_02220 [Anaerolineaceae bacterium]
MKPMKLSAPRIITFWIAVLLAVFGFLGAVGLPVLSQFAIWLVLAAFIILALGNLMKGM